MHHSSPGETPATGSIGTGSRDPESYPSNPALSAGFLSRSGPAILVRGDFPAVRETGQNARLAARLKSAERRDDPWWRQIAGTFANDRMYAEAMTLGREYRESLRPKRRKISSGLSSD